MSTELNGLPKQWLHWAQCAGLKSDFRGRRHREWHGFYLRGKGRRWRVSDRGTFQVSHSNELFDRWALSLAGEVSVPKTKAEFLRAVEILAAVGRNADAAKIAYMKS